MNFSFIYGWILREPDAEQHIDSKLRHDPNLFANTAYGKGRQGNFNASSQIRVRYINLAITDLLYQMSLRGNGCLVYESHKSTTFRCSLRFSNGDETCIFHIDRGIHYTDHHVNNLCYGFCQILVADILLELPFGIWARRQTNSRPPL